jgi:hypothetical protein
MNLKRYLSLCALSLFMVLGTVDAVTRVYLCNRTSQSLSLSYVQKGALLTSDKWSHDGPVSTPGTVIEIVSFDRAFGIKDNALYEFETNVVFDATTAPIVLRQRLEGTLLSSKLACSASGGSFTHQWFADHDIHEQMFKIGNDAYKLTYYAKNALVNDDIHYIIEPVLASEPLVSPAL